MSRTLGFGLAVLLHTQALSPDSARAGDLACLNWSAAASYAGHKPCIAYDSARGRAVLFDTATINGMSFSATWEWDGASWSRHITTSSPPTRYWPAMVYDESRGVIVLFGGNDNNTHQSLNDTWEYDGSNWIQRFPINSPPPCWGHAMAYDSARGVTVLFGGIPPSVTSFLGDTWEWNGQNWTQRFPITRPSPRDFHAMCYDSIRRVTVLVAGNPGGNETWEWDGIAWIQRFSQTTPGFRHSHALAFDALHGQTIMFGGDNGPGDETWIWDGIDWTLKSPQPRPAGRVYCAMAFDSKHSAVTLFGGRSNGDQLTDTWTWDGDSWTQKSHGLGPNSEGSASCFDSVRHQRVIMGGGREISQSTVEFHNSTWTSDGGSWRLRDTPVAPSPRDRVSMFFDLGIGVAVLFGGRNIDENYDDIFYDDTWQWDGESWTQLTPADKPSPRRSHAMVFDSARGVGMLFGGLDGTGERNDTWVWNGGNWIQRFPSSSPPPRRAPAITFDLIRGVVVLFGGLSGGGDVYLDDTWEWDGTNWIERNPALHPSARWGAGMVFDVDRQRSVLFGGFNNGSLGDMWEWDGSNWAQQNVQAMPPSRELAAMVFDSDRHVIVLAEGAGYNGFNGIEDSWEFGPVPPSITRQPAAPFVCESGSVSIEVTSSGTGDIAYQWRKDDSDLSDDEHRFGSQTSTLVLAQTELSDAGSYTCRIQDDCSFTVTNPATLAVYPTNSADGNADGIVDARDIQPFIDALTSFGPVSAQLCAYDLTGEGIVNLDDLAPFVTRLLGN